MTLEARATRLNEIRERVEKATKGPWRSITIHHVPKGHPQFGEDSQKHYMPYDSDDDTEPGGIPIEFSKENVDFIAYSREDVPFLLGEVERLRRMLYRAIVELGYVQEAEHHSQCASAEGRAIVDAGMKLLGVADLSVEPHAFEKAQALEER